MSSSGDAKLAGSDDTGMARTGAADRVTGNQPPRRYTAVVPRRLAVAPERELPPAVDSDGHNAVVQTAMRWQAISSYAAFWEMASRGDENRAYALAGQMASAGEQLALAYAAGVEVALWQEEAQDGDSAIAREMGMRAMGEAQSLFVIGTGHSLINVGVRALSLRADLRDKLVDVFSLRTQIGTLDPFSSQRSDWLPMSPGACQKLRTVAELTGSKEVLDLVAPIVEYGAGPVWSELIERRGEDFHRWRPQSHGMQGVPHHSPWVHDEVGRSLSVGTPIYDEAEGLAEKVALLADAGMLGLAVTMDAFYAAWPAASDVLGGPSYKPR